LIDEMSDENLISKTRRKRQMEELQDIGAALTRLPADQLARLDLPEDLREAVVECRRLTKHEAIRRQLQYIGKVMRELDAGPIAAQLESMHAPSHRETALFHRAERWRTELLADPGAVERFTGEFPEADPHRLRALARAALEERQAERPPRRYRELFQVINAILQDHGKGHP
jgi:ribosome-associated protein